MIRTRLVLNFYGFEPSHHGKLTGRLLYCATKTANLWDFEVKQDDAKPDLKNLSTQCNIRSTHSDWQVDTKIVQFGFGDIISNYFAGFFPLTLAKHIFTYLSLLLSGLPIRYFRASTLYGVFLLFPLVLMAVFLAISLGIVMFLGGLVQTFGAPLHDVVLSLISLSIFILLCRWPGTKMHLLLSLAHWSYARDVALQKNPAIEARYGEVADLIIKELSAAQYDEIIVSGHSFGSTWATVSMGQALLKQPDLMKGKDVAFLRLGSSLMNTALFQRPNFVHKHIRNLARVKNIFWHEFQTKDDVVSFYKADFVKHLDLQAPAGGYMISRINFKHSMDIKRYRKIKRSFYHVHRQYGLYQDRRVSFDYLIRLLGPIGSKQLAQNPEKFALIHDDVQLF